MNSPEVVRKTAEEKEQMFRWLSRAQKMYGIYRKEDECDDCMDFPSYALAFHEIPTEESEYFLQTGQIKD